ncbi:MAG: hypothetical protein HQ500_07040 [Flavobacteriales bacterium]|nr:hypothetical protein [Flavobacteriales bacterium]
MEPKPNHHRRSIPWRRLFLEVIVVFLGVTAGFLLNNWRNDQKEAQLRDNYVTGFLQDLDHNIESISQDLEADSLWLDRAMPFLLDMRAGVSVADSASAITSMIIGVSQLDIHEGTYFDLSNSGNLNLFENYGIRSSIVGYQSEVKGVRFLEDYMYRHFSDKVMPLIYREYDLLKASYEHPEIVDNTEFHNIFAGYLSLVQQRRAAFKELLAVSLQFRTQLRAQLTD